LQYREQRCPASFRGFRHRDKEHASVSCERSGRAFSARVSERPTRNARPGGGMAECGGRYQKRLANATKA
jgi:hypothetical protein